MSEIAYLNSMREKLIKISFLLPVMPPTFASYSLQFNVASIEFEYFPEYFFLFLALPHSEI